MRCIITATITDYKTHPFIVTPLESTTHWNKESILMHFNFGYNYVSKDIMYYNVFMKALIIHEGFK